VGGGGGEAEGGAAHVVHNTYTLSYHITICTSCMLASCLATEEFNA
jgi:hypothetical protein